MSETITMVGALKQQGKAIKVDAEGEAEITFICPASELPEVVKLMTMKDSLIRLDIRKEAQA